MKEFDKIVVKNLFKGINAKVKWIYENGAIFSK
jgi:hypothetical protein